MSEQAEIVTEAQKMALAALRDIMADSAVDPATRVEAAKAILYLPPTGPGLTRRGGDEDAG